MKKIDVFLILFFLACLFIGVKIVHAQNIPVQVCQNAQNDASNQAGLIATYNANIANAQAALTADNATIAQCTSSYAQTPAQVNWDAVDALEIAGIRYTQWSAAETSVNWTNIVPLLGVLGNCSVAESTVNWTNMVNCEAHGVVMGQPYGNWPTGIGDFWCGHGAISGTC